MNLNDDDAAIKAMELLGERIAIAREAQGFSAAQLARRLGVKTNTMHAWESGRSQPRSNRLLMLAGMLNVSPTWLLTGTGDSPAEVQASTEMMHIRSTVERLRESLQEVTEELQQLEKRLETYQSFQD
ncbi:MAG: helix-turn-helix domain-containing protein [Xanthomonadales bacterium]|nr:helix-turn-helix domain-containing protein [Xanthomonadales bacterium]